MLETKLYRKLQESIQRHEAEDFYHYSWANKLTDRDKIKDLIKQIRADVKDAQENKNRELVQELRQDLQKAKALLSNASESRISTKNSMDFDSVGGSLNFHLDLHEYEDGIATLGLNCSSSSEIVYVGPQIDKSSDYRKIKADKRAEILMALKNVADEFDAKIAKCLADLGFKLKGRE